MEDDIDIEEHDLLKNPALRSVFPDLSILKCEVIDFGEETRKTAESTLEVNSGNLPPVSSMQDLDVKPDILCIDIDDTLTVTNYNLSESEKVDFHIKKESENDESNDLPIYKNRIILGKINVDATDEECNNDAISYSDNVAKHEDITNNEPDIEVAIDSDEDRSNMISKQYYEKENRLLVKIVLTDCYTSLLDNKCYCAQCTVLFPTTEAYSEHYMSTHTETTNSTKASAALVTRKKITHRTDKPFTCDTCEKRFKYLSQWNRHKLIHSGEKPFECETCKKRFKLKYYLNTHKLIHTGEKPFECETCKKKFRQKHHLNTHKLIHTSLLGNKCYCAQCTVLFPTTEAYSEHYMSTHTETTNSTKASTALVTPKNIIHTGEKPFGCETCKKRFGQKSSMNSHKLIHTGEKPFECETCKKKFRKKHHLNSHRLIHTGEKPFECVTCKKKFSCKGNLVQHTLVHIK